MYTSIDKAIIAAVMAVIFLLQTNGVLLPDFLTQDWVTNLVAIATPLVVWWIPNKGTKQ
jgi:hypothetical protein